MQRWCLGRNGTVYNIVGNDDGEDPPIPDQPKDHVFLDPTGSSNVGDTYDPKEVHFSTYDQALATMLFQIVKGTIAIPQPNITQQQFKNYVKSLMP